MFNRFLIIFNDSKEKAYDFCLEAKDYIEKNGFVADFYDENYTDLDLYDAAIVVGGDGTIIDAAFLSFDHGFSVIGVNFGKLGYLSTCDPENFFDMFDNVISGNYIIENRSTIEGYIIRNGLKTDEFTAVNDISLHRGLVNCSLDHSVIINDQEIARFKSDGILVATPTGSTAYNLSAGGPVIAPDSSSFVITQICAHSLNDCPIVVSDGDMVKIKIENDNSEPCFVADHFEPIRLYKNDVIVVQKGSKIFKTVKTDGENFYSILRRKITGQK